MHRELDTLPQITTMQGQGWRFESAGRTQAFRCILPDHGYRCTPYMRGGEFDLLY